MSKAKLLIVEDDPNLGDILQEYLTMKGYETTLCRDGEEGWAKFKKDKYNLAVLDIMMPKVDGYEVLQYVNENYADKGINVLFMSAKNKAQDIEKGLELGATDYITKPFSVKKVIERIETLIGE
jgi:DNA-binding response OmpR family regulator